MKSVPNLVHIIKVFILSSSLAASFAFADGRYQGTWEGKTYDISISDTFDYVRGNWGQSRFELQASDTFQYVKGNIGQSGVDLRFSKTFTYVKGKSACGAMDYRYSETFRYVEGFYCGQKFKFNVPIGITAAESAQEIFEKEMLQYFPFPVHGLIKQFFRSRILF
jgi:hypothetical protein